MDYQCCFCGEGILDADTSAVILIAENLANWRQGQLDRPSQGLFAHADCMGSRLHVSVPFDAGALLEFD